MRTLHYYEEIGLLTAAQRSDGGHRVYSADNVQRLYRITLLRRLGLPLAEVRRALDDPGRNLRDAMATHLAELEQRLEAMNRLRSRLAGLLSTGTDADGFDDDLFSVLEEMTMIDAKVQQRITFLVYRDLDAAYRYVTEVFGLGPGRLDRTEDGRAVHGEVHAGDGVIWLHREDPDFGLSAPHHRAAVERGARIAQEPVDQDYGYRVYSAWDPEGGLWSFMRPIG